MKNIIHLPEQSIDRLPKTLGTHRHQECRKKACTCAYCRDYYQNGVPRKRISRFLRSRVGISFNNVVQEFVRLDWVPGEYRTYRKLTEFVETHTFLSDNKIHFYDTARAGKVEYTVDDAKCEIFYVHPVSQLLCHKARHRKYCHKEIWEKWYYILSPYNQLIKLYGIWYHVYLSAHDAATTNYHKSNPLLYDKNRSYDAWLNNKQDLYLPTCTKLQLNTEQLKHYKLTNDKN